MLTCRLASARSGTITRRSTSSRHIERISSMTARLRAQPPSELAGSPVVEVSDLAQGYKGLPPTDGVLVLTEAGDRVIARPSGSVPV